MSGQEVIVPDTAAEEYYREDWECYHHPGGCDSVPAPGRPTVSVSVEEAKKRGFAECKKCAGKGRPSRHEDVIKKMREVQGDSPDFGTDGATPETVAGMLDMTHHAVRKHLRADERVEQVWAVGEKRPKKAYRLKDGTLEDPGQPAKPDHRRKTT
jgi:hypothetical protein